MFGVTRWSPIQASKICVTGASLFVHPELFFESTRMTVEVTPPGALKYWNPVVVVGLYGHCTASALTKQPAWVIRHVMTCPPEVGAANFRVKSIGFPATVLAGFGDAGAEKPCATVDGLTWSVRVVDRFVLIGFLIVIVLVLDVVIARTPATLKVNVSVAPTPGSSAVAWLSVTNDGKPDTLYLNCLLYTSDAADERSSVDLGGRRIIKKK